MRNIDYNLTLAGYVIGFLLLAPVVGLADDEDTSDYSSQEAYDTHQTDLDQQTASHYRAIREAEFESRQPEYHLYDSSLALQSESGRLTDRNENYQSEHSYNGAFHVGPAPQNR